MIGKFVRFRYHELQKITDKKNIKGESSIKYSEATADRFPIKSAVE